MHTHNLVNIDFKNWIKNQKIHVLLFDKLAKINITPTGWGQIIYDRNGNIACKISRNI